MWCGHEGHTSCRRPADAAADNAPTVTRHAVERREVIVVPTISGAPLQPAAAKTSAHFPIQFQICLSRQSGGHNHHRLQWKAAIIQVERELTVVVLVVMCLWRWHKRWNRQKSHTLRWRSTMKVSFQRDREGDPRRTAGQVPGSPEYTVGCPGCDGRSYRHLLKCQQKRVELGLCASSSYVAFGDDVVMHEAPTPLEEEKRMR